MLRTSAYSFLLIAPAYIVADLAPGSSAASPQFLQGGSLAVLCWVVWYLLSRTFPALQEAQESERKAHMEAQEKAREDFKESLDSLVKSIDKLAGKQAE